jgi:hypothetical protein
MPKVVYFTQFLSDQSYLDADGKVYHCPMIGRVFACVWHCCHYCILHTLSNLHYLNLQINSLLLVYHWDIIYICLAVFH